MAALKRTNDIERVHISPVVMQMQLSAQTDLQFKKGRVRQSLATGN